MAKKQDMWESKLGPRITKRFNELFSKLRWAGQGTVQITGIIGKPETESRCVLTQLFSGKFSDAYLKEKAVLDEKYDCVVTEQNRADLEKDLIEAIQRVEAAQPIDDQRKTEDQIAEEARLRNESAEQRRIEEEKRNAAEKIETDKLKKEFPYLTLKSDTRKSEHALVGHNVRQILKRNFPGHTFSVRTECFAGGDACDVKWTDGPTDKEVNDLIGRFKEGYVNSMEDIYEYTRDAFHVFGGVKYLHTYRTVSKIHFEEIAKELEIDIIFDEFDRMDTYKMEGWQCRHITDEIRSRSFYVRSETPKESDPVPDSDGTYMCRNEEKNGIEIHFPDKPEPDTLDRLKSNGWRWSRYSKCWYKKYSEQAEQFARSIIGE
jgi:hypothetical protein